MRKFFVVIFVVMLLGSTVPIGIAEDLPRHRDPLDFGAEQPNLASLEELYGFIFNFTLAGDFEGALRWLDVADLVFAPDATLAVMGRFTTLFRSEVQDLNLTKADIETVKGLVRKLKWDEARTVVEGALARLNGANVTVGEMDVAVLGLAALLKGSPQAILAGDEELRGMIEAYRGELLALLEQVEASENPTT